MSTSELEGSIDGNLKESLNSLSNFDSNSLYIELDRRIEQTLASYRDEIKDISLVSVTAAPFSLTILLSPLDIDQLFLGASFFVLMFNVLVLYIGQWYVNSEFRKNTAVQVLDAISIESSLEKFRDEKENRLVRTDALVDVLDNFSLLQSKRKLEPYSIEKILSGLRTSGLILMSLGLIFLLISVGKALI